MFFCKTKHSNYISLLRHTQTVGLTAAIGIGIGLLWLDQPIAIEFSDHYWYQHREYLLILTELGRGEPYFLISIAGYFLARFVLKKKSSQIIQKASGMSFSAFLYVGILIVCLKSIFGRLRPHLSPDYNPLVFDFFKTHWDWHSFPSGHSQVLWVAATLSSLFWPRFKWGFFFLASLFALTRILLNQHFLSDVIMGSTIGYVGTLWTCYFYCKKHGAESLPQHQKT